MFFSNKHNKLCINSVFIKKYLASGSEQLTFADNLLYLNVRFGSKADSQKHHHLTFILIYHKPTFCCRLASNYNNYLRAWLISKLFKLSVNPKIIDKNLPSDKRLASKGFLPVEATLEEICGYIDAGFAISYCFKNDHRKTENFICTDFICLDMDGGREIDEVLNDHIVKKYGSIFHTTASHTPDHHRFRIIFFLPRTLTDVEEVKCATRSLAMRLKGDMSVTDGARMFYGCEGSDPILLGNSLSEDYLNDLIEDSKIIPKPQRSSTKNNTTTNKSKLLLDMDQIVKTDKGKLISLKDITKKTSIYCPYHYDEKASSFVAFNHAHIMYHRCSACQVTRWSSDSSYGFNFNDFEDAVINLKEKKSYEQREGFDDILNELSKNNVINAHVQKAAKEGEDDFLNIDEIRDGITFIKSPKASGKTYFLQHHIRKYVSRYKSFQEYEEDTFGDDKPLYHKDRHVLLIGHRQSLIGEICKRIGLHCYLDDKKIPIDEAHKNRERYGICLDSLTKVSDNLYQTIIIDEVEQVLTHFLSDTLGQKRYKIYKVFSELIRKAKRVIVLDADISWISFNTLTDIIREGTAMNEKTILRLRKNLQIHIKNQRPKTQTIKMFARDGQLIEEIKKSVLNKERIFISSNSKTRIDALNELLGKMEKKEKIKIRRLIVTSENSKTTKVQGFILDVKNEILNYDVVLASPSLSTGIDITFDKDAKLIDHVFGFYEVQVNNHFDIDQQISRVRHPKKISVWVSPRVFNFETELGVVEEDVQNEYLAGTSKANFVVHPNDVQDDLGSFTKLCARLVSVSRHSMNSLRNNFIKSKEEQGFIIEWEKDDETKSGKGLSSYRNAKKTMQEKEISNLLLAEPLDLYDYKRFQDRVNILQLPVTTELKRRYRRTSLELFYKKPITQELIEEDEWGKFRKQIRRYISMTDEKELSLHDEIQPHGKSYEIHMKSVYDYKTGSILLNKILNATPILEGTKVINNDDFSIKGLSDFIEISLLLSPYVETQLELNLRKNFKENPTQHLGQLLKLIGLKLNKVRTSKVNDKRFNHYKLDSAKLYRIEQIARRLTEPENDKKFLHNELDNTDLYSEQQKLEFEMEERYKSGWQYMNDQHNFQYSDAQVRWLCPGYNDYGERNPRRIIHDHEKWAIHFGF